jgi:hypothetical protein
MSTGLAAFTLFHVAISLVGIFSGFVVIFGMLTSKCLDGWTALFLTTTVATSVTGFLFPFHGFTPADALGIISLAVLSITLYARYGRHITGAWRWIYVITAVLAQYLNFFVLIVQSFMKVPALHDLAPTQTEPPFKIAQITALVIFIAIGVTATIKFRPSPDHKLQQSVN